MGIYMTWASYALMVSVCLVVYYGIMGLTFYRARTKMSSVDKEDDKSGIPNGDNDVSADVRNRNLFGEEIIEEFTPADNSTFFQMAAQDFADEIVAYTSSCEKNITKEELVQSIHRIIQKYPSLKDGGQRYELNQLIAVSTENYCSIHISADELGELWKS